VATEPLRARTAHVPEHDGGKRLDAVVRSLFGLSWTDAREAIRTGKVFVGDPAKPTTDPAAPALRGATVELRPAAPRPHVARLAHFERAAIVYLDTHVVVVDKPAGISTVPFGEEPGDEETLDAVVREILARRLDRAGVPRGRAPLGVVHRLDKETSGLLVFTRSVAAKKHLANQFRQHTTHRRYLAIVHGEFRQRRTFRTHLVDDRGDGLRGSAGPNRREGRLAVTHVEPLRVLAGATLVRCQLETGRTHQIRIHLSEAGYPLVGERVYIRRFSGSPLPAPRLMLHATELGFEHPATGERAEFALDPPDDFQEVLAALQKPREAAPSAQPAPPASPAPSAQPAPPASPAPSGSPAPRAPSGQPPGPRRVSPPRAARRR
jgi:23S rRNA pseudouridine1911/1915/1917 synthase